MGVNAIFGLSYPINGDGSTTTFSINLRSIPAACWGTDVSGGPVDMSGQTFAGIYGTCSVDDPTSTHPVTVNSQSLSNDVLTLTVNTALANNYLYNVYASILCPAQ